MSDLPECGRLDTAPRRSLVATFLLLAACCGLALLAVTEARPDEFSPDRYGIGATLVQPEDSTFVEIKGCTKNGPAARAGLQPGDRILEIDGQPIRDWSFQQVMDHLIRSQPLPLRITVRRGATTLSFELLRMRLADIAAGEGIRFEATGNAGVYRMVPLHEIPQLNVGDIVPLDSLMNPACRPGSLYPAKTNTLLYFWASWCGPCKTLFDKLRGLSTDCRMVAINVDRTCGEFTAAVAANDPPGAEFWAGGWYGRLSQSLGIYRRGIPTAALLDPEGRLVRIVTGVEPIVSMITPDPTEPPAALKPVFEHAASEFKVPVDVLLAVAYVRSHWDHRDGKTSLYGEVGVMGFLTMADKPRPLDRASELIGLPVDSLRSLDANVRGAAALLAHEFAEVHGNDGIDKKMLVVENWRSVLPRFGGYHSEGADDIFFRQFSKYLAARGFGGS